MQRQRPTPHTRKRTHLKPSQVAVLQESFVTNALPDAAKRSHLARALEVSERTVQIWFQNRRAKARKSEAYSLGQEMTSLMPNVRTGWIEPPKLNKPSSLTHRIRSVSSRPDIKKHAYNGNISPTCVLTTRALSEGTDHHQGRSHLSIPVNTLRIGSWARFMSLTSSNEFDLICYCHLLEKKLVWQVQEGGAKFRIEVDFDQISQIRLGQQVSKQQQQQLIPSLSTSTSTTSTSTSSSSLSTTPPAPTPQTTTIGQLQIHVAHPHQVQFSMCQDNKEGWVQCADFSERTQASIEQVHILQGVYDALRHICVDISNRLPELAHKMILLNPIIPEPTLLHHPLKLMTSEASYLNARSSISTFSFDEYMQFLQPEQQNYSTPSPSMFI